MNRLTALLLVVIVAELVAGAAVWYRKPEAPAMPERPVPDLSLVDPATAAQLRDQAARCQTPTEWAALGESYMAYGYFPEGEACYRYAKEKEPENAVRAHEWAFAVERLGRLAEANTGYEEAVRLGHPDPGGCWYYVGRNHLRMGNTQRAGEAFEKAGDQPAARYEVAKLLARGGKPDEAVPILERLAVRYPTAVQPPLLRHRIELLRDSPLAVVYADRANRIHPLPSDPMSSHLPTPFDRDWKRLEDTHERLGAANEVRAAREAMKAGDLATAGQRARAALAAGWAPDAADALAEVEFRMGRPVEAARLLQEIVDRAGPSAPILDGLGDALLAAGRPDAAVRAWTRATELGIGATAKMPHLKLAQYYRKAGNAAAANRYESRAWLAAGHDVFWAGRYAEARLPFEKAVEFDPRLAAGWFYLGEVRRLTGRPDEARVAYRWCLDIDPNFGRALTGLALLDITPRKP